MLNSPAHVIPFDRQTVNRWTMETVDLRCMLQEETYTMRYECMDCRRVSKALYSNGHPPVPGCACEGCGGPAELPPCPYCGARDIVKEGLL